MSNWYRGQKVVCITKNWWKLNNYNFPQRCRYAATGKKPRSPGPAYGETCVISGVLSTAFGIALTLHGYSSENSYTSVNFRPLDPLTEAMDRIESEGCPEVHELETTPA